MNIQRQKQITLEIIRESHLKRGYAPTLGEIANGLGVKSRSAAHRIVSALQVDGKIRCLPGKKRSIELIDAPLVLNPPPYLFAELRLVARQEGVTVEAIALDAIRDGLSRSKSVRVSRETSLCVKTLMGQR
jgi:SOS-response transcriptional repressor LexA